MLIREVKRINSWKLVVLILLNIVQLQVVEFCILGSISILVD